MKTIEMDTELLELKTRVRCANVLLCYEMGWQVDWDDIERHVEASVAELKRDRSMEPYRAAGRAVREFVETMSSMFEAFNQGLNGEEAR